ncbi:Serine/threonine-protein kinase Nek4 [Pteropus alecto]|uniref:Serine/threonine-protein kinase Nek4 n=1 Tax=Pteropus alecto TaxID=9402 RepID=L5L5U1_PTEAL|nr:Serine/threonine-protein kinase Nek4 [Pteropus alecto]
MSLAAYCYPQVLGRGSYGEVMLVRHQQYRQAVSKCVIKKLNLRKASSPERKLPNKKPSCCLS